MALECGIFELDNPDEKRLKTAPYVYEILIDKNNMVYVGGVIAVSYLTSFMNQERFEFFKTGQVIDMINNDIIPEDLQKELLILGSQNSAFRGKSLERIYSKHFKEHMKNLRKDGAILDVGCGCGYTLVHWAKKFKKTR
ncbi:MAG: hypothetical protein ACFFAH_17465, partial [Promethearchaeota archaeon]